MNNKSTKDTLLSCAAELMSEKGYNGVGLKEILDAAGVPKGSFYHYFKSKEEFAIEIIRINFCRKNEYMRMFFENREKGPMERIHAIIDSYKTSDYKNDSLLVKMVAEMAELSEPIKCELQAGMNETKRMLSDCLSAAQKAGEIDKSHNIEELTEFIFTGWEGATIRSKMSGNSVSFDVFCNYLFSRVLV